MHSALHLWGSAFQYWFFTFRARCSDVQCWLCAVQSRFFCFSTPLLSNRFTPVSIWREKSSHSSNHFSFASNASSSCVNWVYSSCFTTKFSNIVVMLWKASIIFVYRSALSVFCEGCFHIVLALPLLSFASFSSCPLRCLPLLVFKSLGLWLAQRNWVKVQKCP